MTAADLSRNAHVLVLQELRSRFTYAGSPSRTAALDAAISALAARQPGGQIVGYMDPDAEFMLARPGDCVLMGQIVLWREPRSKYTKPLYDAPPAQALDLPYSLDADPAGIRARVCDAITGALMVGAQGHTPPPAGHWAEPFWKAARADAAAQAVDSGLLPHSIRLIQIPGRNSLDPINVFVQDYELGRGRIVVTCYGQAWCGFWGAMGDRTVMQFVAACDADYVAGNMLSGRHERVLKRERDYVERIATEVIAEFRALIDGQAVRNG